MTKGKNKVIHVLFVCLGNICRSPLAQGIFEKKIKELSIENMFYADSAGTSAAHEGSRPHSGSLQKAKKYGLFIENYHSRPVNMQDHFDFDFIIAMDSQNYDDLENFFQIPSSKLFKMRDFDLQEPSGDVPDPWGSGDSSFQIVYDILDRSIDKFIEYLKEKVI